MLKILGVVFCLVIVFMVLAMSEERDTARVSAYDHCEKSFINEGVPVEGRESFISNCMD